MIRKIFKTGHSAAITLSSRLLENLGLKLGDSVKIEFDGQKEQAVIRPGGRERQLSMELHSRPKLGAKR